MPPPRRPRVCVLLSTYNGERWLDDQLASLAAQEGVEVALHVRDDGSSDATLAALARHAGRWPTLANVPSGPNLKPPMSVLTLLATAPEADYYGFCDQDDVWRPGKLARATAAIAADAGPALYCSNVTCVAEDLAPLGVPRENGDARFQHLLFENIAYGCTTVVNRAARDLIAARPPERGVIMHDWWCALVVAAFGRVHYDPEPGMLLYRQHGANSIGAQTSQLGVTLGQALRLLRDPAGYYRIHAQVSEFHRLFGADLDPARRASVERLIFAKQSLAARLRYAVSGDLVRSGVLGGIAARALIVTGWY